MPNHSCLGVVVAGVALLVTACGPASERTAPATTEAQPVGAAAPPPNVVLISLDTVRPDHLGCYGYDRPTSPELDAFAAGAAVFLQTRAQAPWTLPSHLSLFTSMLPSHNGVEDLNQRLSARIPTLPELLAAGGYHTAALVNNGQMKPVWGFARGFDTWREFQVDTPAGAAENISAAAVRWLAEAAQAPFLLFLHYYDAHDPYAAPEPFRSRFGVCLSGAQAREILWRHRTPARNIDDPTVIRALIAAYDAEIARVDAALGTVLRALPDNTLVVVFSDHGEAFEEHGWTTHGATLFEEEIRVVLLVRPPTPLARGVRRSSPVMLLDVMPTILGYCGLTAPLHIEGVDLRGLIAGEALPPRLQRAGTKRLLEGVILRAVVRPPLKRVHSFFDATTTSYELPGETGAAPVDPAAALLDEALTHWRQAESYWLVHTRGPGRWEVVLHPERGAVSLYLPHHFDAARDALQLSRTDGSLTWNHRAGAGGNALFVQLSHHVAVDVNVRLDGVRRPGLLHTRRADGAWDDAESLPCHVPPTAAAPFADPGAIPAAPGVYVAHYGPRRRRGSERIRLGADTLRQLRALGYVQ